VVVEEGLFGILIIGQGNIWKIKYCIIVLSRVLVTIDRVWIGNRIC
jgi:hypothetical protein